MLWTS